MKNTKFQLNISKIVPARIKKHSDMGCEYIYSKIQTIKIYIQIKLLRLQNPIYLKFSKD